MPKVTFIGGGSAKFVSALARDLFSFEALQGTTVSLMDIDPVRLDRSRRLVERIVSDKKLPATVTATTDRRAALEGADYVVFTVMVGGFAHYESDGAIPVNYGVLPTVGDTVGPGAVMRMVRTAPVVRGLAADIQAVCPDAWVFTYTNPMAMVTGAFLECGHARTVGLCHSIQSAYREVSELLHVPPTEVRYTAAGINHVDFYLTLTHKGRDLYPSLRERQDEILARRPELRVKFELLESLGAWPAEGPYHQTEYYPWFRKNRAMAEGDYATETMWGYRFDMKMNAGLDSAVEDQIAGRSPLSYARSSEYGAWMVNAIQTDAPLLIYGNVKNRGCIENLPPHAVVEVPCYCDAHGVTPATVGALPLPLAAAMMPHVLFHQMALKGVWERDRRLLVQAMQADPMTGAVLTLPRIKQMAEELFRANAEHMKDWP